MSHPHEVPEGWVNGEPLQVVGGGPRYALMQRMTSEEALYRNVSPDDIGAIQFDSREDMEAFAQWWCSDKASSASPQ